MKRIITIFTVMMLLFAAGITVYGKTNNNDITQLMSAFKDSDFYSGGVVHAEKNEYKEEILKDLCPISDEGIYIYWYNQDGLLELLTRKDNQTYTFSDVEQRDFDKQKAAAVAEGWFDKVFEKEELMLGDDKETLVSDFNGGNYLVTINQQYEGNQTGNTASISISADGQVISAAFVHNKLSLDELLKPVSIDEAEALIIASTAVDREIQKLYDESLVKTGEAEFSSCKYRVFRGVRFWEIELNLPIVSEKDTGIGSYLFCHVRVNADTGDCIEIATPLK